ncbi:hypothetical protein CEXT_721321 [Caerostris extrusa]|uniref:Uncharacterized protein n=1 Tax=Caerostris extrusa TaxID=172846 RepID=A0AAV4QB26_CAEEX|nr:hypothetical protein CEXT_721321 [Caerostris extrusa]
MARAGDLYRELGEGSITRTCRFHFSNGSFQQTHSPKTMEWMTRDIFVPGEWVGVVPGESKVMGWVLSGCFRESSCSRFIGVRYCLLYILRKI